MSSSNPFQTSYDYNHAPRPANRVLLTSFGSGGPAHIAQRHSYQNQYMPHHNQTAQQQHAPPSGPPPPLSTTNRAHASYSGQQLTTACCCCARDVRYILGWLEYECASCGIVGPVPGSTSSAASISSTSSKLRKAPTRRSSGGQAPSSMYAPSFAPPASTPPPLPPRSRLELNTDVTTGGKNKDNRAVMPARAPLTAKDVEYLAAMFSSSAPADPPLELLATLFLDSEAIDEAQSPSPSPTPSSPSSPSFVTTGPSPRNPFRRMSGNVSVLDQPEASAASSNARPSNTRNPFRRSSFGFNRSSPPSTPAQSAPPPTLNDRLAALALTRAAEHDASGPDALLTRAIRQVFSSLDVLGRSFTSGTGIGGDGLMKTINTFYGLVKRQRAHLDVLRSCVEGLLDRPGKALFDDQQALWAPILLECPILRREYTPDHAQRAKLLGRLIGLIANLPNAAHHHIVTQHLAPGPEQPPYPAEELERKVDLVISFISLRLGQWQTSGRGSYEEDWGVRAGAKVGALLFAANAAQARLPISSFYCTLVDALGEASAVESFVRWEQRTGFTLCQYPFLLSLGIKIHLLTFDGQRQMMDQARQALHSTLARRQLEIPFLQLKIRRQHLVRDSLEQISSNRANLKKKLMVTFDGEEGIDAGGLRKEWFLLLCRQLFDPQWGMFKHDADSNLCWFNPGYQDVDGDEYFLVGVVVGLACYNAATLDIPLPTAVYKKLMNEPVGLEDLPFPALARGLKQLLDYDGSDVEDVFCRSFVGEVDEWGEVREIELVPGGANKMVNNDNRQEFVERYTAFLLTTSIAEQFRAFSAGFSLVTSGNSLSLFKGEELELLVRGSDEPLDIDALRAVTQYHNWPGDGEHETVQLFWHVFKHEFDAEAQRSLLSFITGSDRIPATGTTSLYLKITNAGYDTTRYPVSHTCFNELCIPCYIDAETLRTKLESAMKESEGFGLK